MAKFKKGDRVRRVSADTYFSDLTPIGGINIVDEDNTNIPYVTNEAPEGRRNVIHEDEYELATPSPIPDTVTIGGVEYVRKPEREFKYGDWVKTHDKKTVGFVLGHNYNKVACAFNDGEISWYSAHELTYISTATVPE